MNEKDIKTNNKKGKKPFNPNTLNKEDVDKVATDNKNDFETDKDRPKKELVLETPVLTTVAPIAFTKNQKMLNIVCERYEKAFKAGDVKVVKSMKESMLKTILNMFKKTDFTQTEADYINGLFRTKSEYGELNLLKNIDPDLSRMIVTYHAKINGRKITKQDIFGVLNFSKIR